MEWLLALRQHGSEGKSYKTHPLFFLRGFTVKSAVCIDTSFVVGAVVTMSDAFVQVFTIFTITYVTSSARALEGLKISKLSVVFIDFEE